MRVDGLGIGERIKMNYGENPYAINYLLACFSVNHASDNFDIRFFE